jgi:hypothetical protein
VARLGLSLGKEVHVFAGRIALSRGIPGLFVHEITPAGTAAAEAFPGAPEFLERAVRLALSRA